MNYEYGTVGDTKARRNKTTGKVRIMIEDWWFAVSDNLSKMFKR
jgi:hypothetical protein